MSNLVLTKDHNGTSVNHVNGLLPNIQELGCQVCIDKIDGYLAVMHQEKGLDKIKESLSINKKTAFDWRHKILVALQDTDKENFTGITESNGTFFLDPKEGQPVTGQGLEKGGSTSKAKGISK